jgi:hypothetical protein
VPSSGDQAGALCVCTVQRLLTSIAIVNQATVQRSLTRLGRSVYSAEVARQGDDDWAANRPHKGSSE